MLSDGPVYLSPFMKSYYNAFLGGAYLNLSHVKTKLMSFILFFHTIIKRNLYLKFMNILFIKIILCWVGIYSHPKNISNSVLYIYIYKVTKMSCFYEIHSIHYICEPFENFDSFHIIKEIFLGHELHKYIIN